MRRPNWPRFRPRMIAAMARVSATAEDWDRQVGGVDVGDVWLDVPSSFPFIKYTHLVLRCFATHWVVNDVIAMSGEMNRGRQKSETKMAQFWRDKDLSWGGQH